LSALSTPTHPWPAPFCASLCASLQKLGAPRVVGNGAVIYPTFWNGVGALSLLEPGQEPSCITAQQPAPQIDTLGNADFDISSNGRALAYVTTAGQIAVLELGGHGELLFTAEGMAPRFSPDSRHLASITSRSGVPGLLVTPLNAPDQPQFLPLTTGLLPIEAEWLPPDGRGLVVAAFHPQLMPWDHGALLLVTLADGQWRTLVPAARRCHVGSPRPAPDGRSIVYITDRDGWLNLWRLDLASGVTEPLLHEAREHLYPAWSPDGRSLGYVSRLHGDYRLAVLDTTSGQVRRLHDVPGLHGTWFMGRGISVAWAPDGSALITTFSAPNRPVEIGAFRLDNGAPRWLTALNSLPASVTHQLTYPEELTWPGSDGLTIQGWLYRPARPGPYPLAVHIHGGPTGDGALWWFYPLQYLLLQGWAILDVNYRGSVGFGRAFLDALIGGWGEAEVADAAAGVEAARRALELHATTIIFGVSAGAYTAAMSCITRPEVYHAGICGSGLYDLTTIAQETDPGLAFYLDTLFGPKEETLELLRRRSPRYRAAELTRPLLIWHGTASTSTPLRQAEDFVGELGRLGKHHTFLPVERETYGGMYAATTAHLLGAMHEFLRQEVHDL